MSGQALQFSRNNERLLYCQGGLQVITGKSPFAQLAGYSISFATVQLPEENVPEEEDSENIEFSEEDSRVICKLQLVKECEDHTVYLTEPLRRGDQDLSELLEDLEDLDIPVTDFDIDQLLSDLFPEYNKEN